jgi:O-antigen/teichoic acid export membrane protein
MAIASKAASTYKAAWDRCDPFVLGPKLGAAGLGFFLIAAETAYLPITEIVAPAADALFAGFAVSQKDGQSSMHLGPKVAITMVLCLLPLVLTISGASGDIVMVLLGAKWQETTPLIAVMVWACAFSPFSWFCSTVLVANGYVRQNFAANLIISIVKLTLLIVVVRFTTKLEWIAAAATLCVMLESLLFMLVLTRSTNNALSAIRSGFFRMLLSTVITAIALRSSGLGWTATMRPPLSAFAHGALIGALTLTVFGVSTLILWKAAGWADGPERWAVDLIRPRLSPAISFFRAIRTKRS